MWDTATEAAEAQGGYLVSILSEGESDFVNALSYPAAGDGPVTIGAVRLSGGNDNTQDWLWASGEPWGFTNWDAGIPNDSHQTFYLGPSSTPQGFGTIGNGTELRSTPTAL